MPKQKINFNNKTVLAVIVVIAVIAGFLFLTQSGITGAATLNSRKDYNIDFELDGQRYTTARMFQNLPPIPEDFWKVRIMIYTNKLRDLTQFGEEYWLQPEWEPSFTDTCLPKLQKADFPRTSHAAAGYGIFPIKQGWTINPGDTIRSMTVIKSACFVPRYQGIGFHVSYPESARFRNELEIWYSDPSKAKEYFTVEYSPQEVVIGPMFPIISSDYAQRIDVNVTASPDTPPGQYLVSLEPGGTSYEFSQAMYRKYLNMYDETGAKFKVGAFTFFIEVSPTE
jgi:hypothetical protein